MLLHATATAIYWFDTGTMPPPDGRFVGFLVEILAGRTALQRVQVGRGSGASLFGKAISLAASGPFRQVRCAGPDQAFGAFPTDGTAVRTAMFVPFAAVGSGRTWPLLQVWSWIDNVTSAGAAVDPERGRVDGCWMRH